MPIHEKGPITIGGIPTGLTEDDFYYLMEHQGVPFDFERFTRDVVSDGKGNIFAHYAMYDEKWKPILNERVPMIEE